MKRIIKLSKMHRRAKRVSDLARNAFWTAVYGCEMVSRYNNELAFIVRPVNAFGFPGIEKIARPDFVIMSEETHIVVKDGYYYELNKRK